MPEPSRAVLLLLGVCGLIWRRRRVRGEGLGGLNGGVGLR
ncbi:MAG: PEP-CTERM sorting domain-containing protein [Verrucomicrobium sp.]